MVQRIESHIIRDVHRDVEYEVVKWRRTTCAEEWIWDYYVFLRKSQVKPEIWDKIWLSNTECYLNNDILKDIPFHYGITHYYRNYDCNLIKIGCDYNHAWDTAIFIDENDVINDAKETIEYIVNNLLINESNK